MEKQAAAGLGPVLTLWAWFDSNRRTVVMVAAITAVVAFVVALVLWQQHRKVITASEALTDVLVAGAFTRSGQPVTAEKFLQLATEYAGTAAAGRAVFQAATTLFLDGKYAEAQTQFQRFITENSDHPFVPQAMYGVAACLEAQGKTEEAMKSYRGIVDRFKTTGLGLAAGCALGRILESQGKLAEALPLFEEVARTDPSGMLGGEARIRVAEIQQKLPPAPAVVPEIPAAPVPAVISTNTP